SFFQAEDGIRDAAYFFKQKTAYEIAQCLVGSEMCIRDRPRRSTECPCSCRLSLIHISEPTRH
ncbi:hypothetical protein, partial [Staphylococcus aureus]